VPSKLANKMSVKLTRYKVETDINKTITFNHHLSRYNSKALLNINLAAKKEIYIYGFE
jgi:hypothetical protein